MRLLVLEGFRCIGLYEMQLGQCSKSTVQTMWRHEDCAGHVDCQSTASRLLVVLTGGEGRWCLSDKHRSGRAYCVYRPSTLISLAYLQDQLPCKVHKTKHCVTNCNLRLKDATLKGFKPKPSKTFPKKRKHFTQLEAACLFKQTPIDPNWDALGIPLMGNRLNSYGESLFQTKAQLEHPI